MSETPAPLAAKPAADRTARLILICFFISGSTGLIYEIIWSRLLALVMGATVYSLSTVLVAYMAGLGLGAFLISGPLRRHPQWSRLKLYGIFEIIIGLWCLALPWLIDLVRPLFEILYNRLYAENPDALFTYSLAQFAICLPLMLIPTTLMGATLPVLADHVTRRPDAVGRSVGLVYGINTLGAVLGTMAAGYFLLPLLGFAATNGLAVFSNIAVGLVALKLAAGERRTEIIEIQSTLSTGERFSRGVVALVFVLFALAGLASMAYQIAWTRIISLVIDSTTYSFTLIVTCYILGLALGAWLLSPMVDREKHPVMLLGLVQMAIGLTALMTVPILGLLSPSVFFMMIRFHDLWWMMQIVMGLIVLALLILPTMLMGATFPLVTRILSQGRGEVGPMVGRAYAVNSLGTIAGSFLAGFVMIPHPALGMQRTLLLATLLNVVLGAIAIMGSPGLSGVRRTATAASVGALWVLMLFICMRPNNDGTRGWDIDIVTSSPFFYYDQLFNAAQRTDLSFEQYLETMGGREDYREGPFTTVVIREGRPGSNQSHMIYSGGRPEASDADTQQNFLAHLGMLFHPDPRRVCVVGLGSGTTARAVTYHPVLEKLDVVEISPAVRELSAKYFPGIHGDLDAADANVIVADGRNHLTLTDQTYDVIVSQPSHPHLTGVANLFTRDFFQICRDRLADDGVCVIWNFSWRIETRDFRSFLASFQDVFPNCYFIEGMGSYVFVVGFKSDAPEINWETMAERLAECRDPRVLADASVGDPQNVLVWETPADVLQHITTGPRGIAAWVGDAPMNTDNNARLEFALPRSYDVNRGAEIIGGLRFERDRRIPTPSQTYDPEKHELIWEIVTHAPETATPAPIRRWREAQAAEDGS